jgi:hypothetical protein
MEAMERMALKLPPDVVSSSDVAWLRWQGAGRVSWLVLAEKKMLAAWT